MHTLNISGNTPEELYFNAIKMLSLMLKGSAALQEMPAPTAESMMPKSDVEHIDDSKAEIIPPKKRTKKAAEANAELDDDISDIGTGPETPAEITLEGNIRPRLREIQKAHSERGHEMKECIAYLMKLYKPFGITKADQLKPEKFAEFMAASDAYLAGTA